ncbi:tRNA-guanine transglycosylase [Candidatus Saccharibacteria bacterium]|nr:tRNA-guanine transglycosylase [Candidatus Saccharibacteria bacterium]
MKNALEFEIHTRLDGALARTGTITTPHGTIQTPAFIPVGTKATLKALRFTPELSMQIQHGIGADITFAFDELTTLFHDYNYQVESLEQRTHPWAVRSLAEHKRLNEERSHRPPQALFGVVQGADYEDLRRQCSKFLGEMDFAGYGLGGALRKSNIGNNVRWMCEELPEDKPRHMLGISEPDDIFDCIENGADTFDCVSPARVGRNGALYTKFGRVNITRAQFKEDFTPFDETCECYTCKNFTSAYLHHLFRADELLANTLATIHNEQFIVKLVDDIRASISDGSFYDLKKEFLANYYSKK